jgi:hypothetical protein
MKNMDSDQYEERLRILKMVENGRVSPGEGATLLSAIGEQTSGKRTEPHTSWGPKSDSMRFFRVLVTDLYTGRRKTTVNIPMGLMDWGLKVGAQFTPEIADINLAELSELIQSEAGGKIIDVVDEEDGEHVEVFID